MPSAFPLLQLPDFLLVTSYSRWWFPSTHFPLTEPTWKSKDRGIQQIPGPRRTEDGSRKVNAKSTAPCPPKTVSYWGIQGNILKAVDTP